MSRHRKQSNRIKYAAILVMVIMGMSLGTIYLVRILGLLPFERPIPDAPLVHTNPTVPGHWLKTKDFEEETDKWSKAALQNPKKVPKISPKLNSTNVQDKPVISKPIQENASPSRRLNKTLDNLNILYLWTDRGELKVLSVMTINHKTKEAALVVVPRFTRLKVNGKATTLEEYYRQVGRVPLAKHLEGLFDIKIANYLNVDQQAVIEISNLVGPLDLKNEKLTIVEAFEQTRTGRRNDDQDVVRAVAKRIVNPQILLKLPEIFWIFAHDVKTNLGTNELLSIYQVSRQSNVTRMKKIALPGMDYFTGNTKYRVVAKETWENIFYDLTQK